MCRKRLPSRVSTQGWTVTILRSLAWLSAPATVPPSASSSRFFSVAWTSVRLPAVASSIASCAPIHTESTDSDPSCSAT